MSITSKRCLLLVSIVWLFAAAGCLGPSWRPVPKARTTGPPYAFNEFGAFSWKVVWGQSQSYFSRSISSMTRQGYRLHDLEVYNDEGDTRFAGIFLKDSRQAYVRWRLTRSQFDRDFKVMMGQGYTPVDLEVINERGTLRYSSVWIENPGGPHWRMRWGLTNGEFLDELETYRHDGYRPTDIEVYGTDSRTRYGYIMVRDRSGAAWTAQWGKTVESMKSVMNAQRSRRSRILDFEPSYPQGKLRLSAVFVNDASARGWTWSMCRSSGQIRRAIEKYGSTHRPIHVAIGPHKEGGMAYLWIWQRN
jgi:hypothetical protein